MRTKISAGDFAVMILVILIAVGCWLFPVLRSCDEVAVKVTDVNDGTVCFYSMDCEQQFVFSSNGIEIFVSVDRKGVWVEKSNCPDGICLHTGKISHPGESIICVPAGLIIEIISEEADYVIG